MISAMMESARRAETSVVASATAGAARKIARFQTPDDLSPQGEADFPTMDYTDVDDYWFDWVQLERAEAKARSRSLPAFKGRGEARARPSRGKPALDTGEELESNPAQREDRCETSCNVAEKAGQVPTPQRQRPVTRRKASRRPCAAQQRGHCASSARVSVSPARKASQVSATESDSGSDGEVQQAPREQFRCWLESRPAMFKLSVPDRSLNTGIAWDFPLAKSEKRELLLQHIAAGERMANEHASEAVREVELARAQHRSRPSRTALSRIRRKRARRRDSLASSAVGS